MHMTRKTFYSRDAVSRIEEAREAIRIHDYEGLNAVMSSGLNPNIPTADGRYLVHEAALNDASGTAIDILVHYHADVNVRWVSYLGWTPAHIAWYAGRADLVEKLRTLGADLTMADTRGWKASRALPCPITRIEARRKLSGFSNVLGKSDRDVVFA